MMKIRKLFPLLLVAVAAAALVPEGGSAQAPCWYCDKCAYGPQGKSCFGYSVNEAPVWGYSRCITPSQCQCWHHILDTTLCRRSAASAEEVPETELLRETLAAIIEGGSIPGDGPFFYVRSGADVVVRNKCDLAEVARVAAAEVKRPLMVVAG